jgi:predicted outer membrane repeat protein
MESGDITSCYFEGNEARHSGGAIFIEGYPGVYTISDCEFVMHELPIAFGDAVMAPSAEEIILRNNRFVSREGGEGLTLVLGSTTTRVIGNTFEDHGGRHATWMRFEESLAPPGTVDYTLEFKNNFLWRDSAPPAEDEAAILMGWSRCTAEFSGNTIVNLSLVLSAHGGSILCTNNIFHKTRTWFHTTGEGVISCNNAWPDTLFTTPSGYYVMEDNLSEDPLFCDEEIGDFRIAFESPCAEENAPDGCGQIGLFAPACRETAVETATWGRIKARFRK